MDRMYSCRAVRGAFAKGCVYVAHPTPWLGQLKPNAPMRYLSTRKVETPFRIQKTTVTGIPGKYSGLDRYW